jgi:hypothetical protein
MRHNSVAFGTPESKDWFLTKMFPQSDAPTNSDFALHTIFTDFYSHIAKSRNEADKAAAYQTLSKAERRNKCLKSCDLARAAVADELRVLMRLLISLYILWLSLTFGCSGS